MTRRVLLKIASFLVAGQVFAQMDEANLRPPQKDLPYLLEASKLIPTEAEPTTGSKSKRGETFSVPGTTSPARTPLPEPIFLFSPGQIQAEQFALFHFEVKNGRREVTLSKRNEDSDNPSELHLTVRKVNADVYRIEAAEMLDPGEYALCPQGVNTAFCFTVY
jgi:hypothetical protein